MNLPTGYLQYFMLTLGTIKTSKTSF